MSKNSSGMAAAAAKIETIDASRPKASSDAEVHAASTPILGPVGGMACKTDADVHAERAYRTPQTILVKPGQLIVHYANLGRWFLCPDETVRLNPDRNILARAEKAFVYQEGGGAKYHDVKFTILRRFFKPKQCQLTGANFDGGDIPMIHGDAQRLAASPLPEGTTGGRELVHA